MRLKSVIKKVLNEALSKERRQSLIDKWRTQNPNLEDPEADELINWFLQKTGSAPFKSTVKVKLYDNNNKPLIGPDGAERTFERSEPHVTKFLALNPNFSELEMNSLENYDYNQIRFLYEEYRYKKLPEKDINLQDQVFLPQIKKNVGGRVVIEYDRSPSPQKIEASKNLWNSPNRAVINSGNVRVYRISSRQESINFGYYLATLHDSPYFMGGGTWCTTYYDLNTNRYQGYRGNRVFYFIIDDSKNPENFRSPKGYDFSQGQNTFNGDPSGYWYLCAIQVMEGSLPGEPKLKYSNIRNNGDLSLTWQNLISVYPELNNHKDVFTYSQMSEKELEVETNILNSVSEETGPYVFSRLPAKVQELYLLHTSTPTERNPFPDDYPALTKPISWSSMNDECQKIYIQKTNSNNFKNRWSSYDFIYEVFTKTPQTARYADKFFQKIGVNTTLKEILIGMSQKRLQLETYRVNAKNPDIEICRSLGDDMYCIFDRSEIKNTSTNNIFYTKNNIEYKKEYKFGGEDIIMGPNGEVYLVESFIVGGPTDRRNFYSITEATGDYNQDKSYFFTQRGYEEFLRIQEGGQEDVTPDEDLDGDFEDGSAETETPTIVKKDTEPDQQNLIVKKSDIKEMIKRHLRK